MSEKGYQQYKEQSILTMTQGELLLVLYDELLKRLKRAELSLEVEQTEVFLQSVNKSIEIVQYLRQTLDYDYEISKELFRMYDFFLYEFNRVKSNHKISILQDVQPLVKELREAFAEAVKRA